SGFTCSREDSSLAMRSSVVNPLTAGLVSSTLEPVAFDTRPDRIDGKLCDSSDAPVPIVYESPNAKYRICELMALSNDPHPEGRANPTTLRLLTRSRRRSWYVRAE